MLLLLLQVIRKLTPGRVADLLAVAFLMASGRRKSSVAYCVSGLLVNHPVGPATIESICKAPASLELSAAAVEKLLRLIVCLHARRCFCRKQALPQNLPEFDGLLFELPGAAQLPAATVVQLVQQALQTEGASTALLVSCMLHPLAKSNAQLSAPHVRGLLPLLSQMKAAVAVADTPARAMAARAVAAWLAMQPGAAAAAAELGLTAADVQDPDAAAPLFGSQEAGEGGGSGAAEMGPAVPAVPAITALCWPTGY
jgi:hypothetical protein